MTRNPPVIKSVDLLIGVVPYITEVEQRRKDYLAYLKNGWKMQFNELQLSEVMSRVKKFT